MAKAENIQIVKLQVETGKANPGSVGSILGQYGVNMRDFCVQFNDRSLAKEKEGTLVGVKLRINNKDRSFEMDISAPPVAVMIKDIIGCKGSGEPNKNKVGKLTSQDVMSIIERKKDELTGLDALAMAKTIAGTARSMGVDVDLKDIEESEES
jgi:large subunit ribosomal protein L11